MNTKQSELIDTIFRVVPYFTETNIMDQYDEYILITWMGKYLKISINGSVFEMLNGFKTETSTSVLLESLIKLDKK